MSKGSKIFKKIIKPKTVILAMMDRGFLNFLPDAVFIKMRYRLKMGKRLNLKNPKTFNEKLQWLKLHNRRDCYSNMVDKYEAKKYIAGKVGEKHIIPTLGVYEKFEDIDFTKLPNRFVIKCTHDSGGVIICKDKSNFDIGAAAKRIKKSLRRNYYYGGREWPYKNVKPRIIVEKYMVDESGTELKDYKVFCFSGEPTLIMVDTERFVDHKRNVYDTDWNLVNININFKSAVNLKVERPKCLKQMIEFSRVLSEGIPFIRVDYYVINDKLFVGELTFFPGSGLQRIEPYEWQYKLGEKIKLVDCNNSLSK